MRKYHEIIVEPLNRFSEEQFELKPVLFEESGYKPRHSGTTGESYLLPEPRAAYTGTLLQDVRDYRVESENNRECEPKDSIFTEQITSIL